MCEALLNLYTARQTALSEYTDCSTLNIFHVPFEKVLNRTLFKIRESFPIFFVAKCIKVSL